MALMDLFKKKTPTPAGMEMLNEHDALDDFDAIRADGHEAAEQEFDDFVEPQQHAKAKSDQSDHNDHKPDLHAFDDLAPPEEFTHEFDATQSNENALLQGNFNSVSNMGTDLAAPGQGGVGAAMTEFNESQFVQPGSQSLARPLPSLPLIGGMPLPQQQRLFIATLIISIIFLALAVFLQTRSAGNVSQQQALTGQSLMHSQRLAKSINSALLGSPVAFAELKDSSDALVRNVNALQNGDPALSPEATGSRAQDIITKLKPSVESNDKNAKQVLAQQETLTKVSQALKNINRQSAELLEVSESISSLKLQQGAAATELSASGQLVMLTQRIGKSANEFLSLEGVSPEAVFLLGKDLNSFQDIANGLLKGSSELRLAETKDPQVKERLETLIKTFAETKSQAGVILGNLQGLVSARQAQAAVTSDSEQLRSQLEELDGAVSSTAGGGRFGFLIPLIFGLAALLSAAGATYVFLQESRQRAVQADLERQEAEKQEQEAKRVNDANQAAILRLMNELQSVAEGDLTQQATVTEDITGAIADSVNYTVEELRGIVGQVQTTAERVTDATMQAEQTSTELLAASGEQLREIRQTGQSVLEMAGRINKVSDQAQQSAQVARQSLQAASSGLSAVQNAISGMNNIRDNIQETSKRIKRLGESSQEIGEITELISDITEQTNVLALNAAIQAASAGDAGRGFSVVAEEVQRLAERSGEATKQISALVKTIQTDTADAVIAMEKSTQGVVEGAKLSDNAGSALTEIDRVSRQLAELIQNISLQTSNEAKNANVVAGNIQHIFAVTEQTGEGTRSTATLIRELSKVAEELKNSVARFRVA
jgi:twitching motility protein PilJ